MIVLSPPVFMADESETWPQFMWRRLKEVAGRLFKADDLPYVVPFVVVLLASHAFFWSTTMFLDAKTLAWFSERHPLGMLDTTACLPTIAAPACDRLLEQLSESRSRAGHHFWIMRFYQIRYFGLLATAYWAGTAATSVLAVIAKSGWDNADHRLKGIFLGLACATAFFGGFPALTAIESNIADNQEAYTGYDNAAKAIRTFLRTSRTSGGEKAPGDFIVHMDERLAAMNRIHITFDSTKVDLGSTRFLAVSGQVSEEPSGVE